MVDGPVCKYSALYVWHLDDASCQHLQSEKSCSMLDKKTWQGRTPCRENEETKFILKVLYRKYKDLTEP